MGTSGRKGGGVWYVAPNSLSCCHNGQGADAECREQLFRRLHEEKERRETEAAIHIQNAHPPLCVRKGREVCWATVWDRSIVRFSVDQLRTLDTLNGEKKKLRPERLFPPARVQRVDICRLCLQRSTRRTSGMPMGTGVEVGLRVV